MLGAVKVISGQSIGEGQLSRGALCCSAHSYKLSPHWGFGGVFGLPAMDEGRSIA